MKKETKKDKQTIDIPKKEKLGESKKEAKSTGKLPTLTADKTLHIPRNVNYYSHFLQHPQITEKDIEWVLKLRNTDSDSQEMQAKLARIPNQAFNVADRKIECRDKVPKSDVSDIQLMGNTASVLHLLRHRIGATCQQSQVAFETGLRGYGNSEKDLREKERKWTTVAKHERKDFPEFIPKYQEEQTLKKQMKETGKSLKMTYTGNLYIYKNYQAFDSDQQYPNYTMKFKQQNLQAVRHLFTPGVKMSTVQYEEGLRELKPIKRPDKETTKKNTTSPPKKK